MSVVKPPVTGEESRSPVRRAALVVGAVLFALTVILVVLFALRACAKPEPAPESPRTVTPAERTEPQTLPPVPGYVATDSLPPTQSAVATAPPPVASADAERIAFRVGGTVFVAAPDGSNPFPAARLGEGPYALSPDGRTLAVVSGGRLALVDVASGGSVDAGEAWSSGSLMGECPVWAPDSRSLLYVRRARGDAEGHEVRRVRRDGTGARTLTLGSSPSVSPDGRVIAVMSPDGAMLVSRDDGSFKRVEIPGAVVTALASGDDRLFVGVLSDEGSRAVLSVRLDGSRPRSVAGDPVDLPRTVWGVLRLSPDGTRLAACATGDDQVSRTSIIPVDGGSATPVDLRRDTYPKGWSRSGDVLNYIQGNAYQGEETALFRVGRDGTGRRVLVSGAQ